MKPQTTYQARLYELLSSMRFAVSLLTVLGIASIIGTVLKQNEPYNNYIVQFGQFWFSFFEGLGLFDVYHSVWFLAILLFLVISTSLCIYRNAPNMLADMRAWREKVTANSLSAFSHQHVYNITTQDATLSHLKRFLTGRQYRYKEILREDGSTLITAKAGSYQRLGYIFTHAAIVVICIGGLMDGNVPFKIQELLGYKKVETLDIPSNQVPAISRLGVGNLSFRANMTLSEGERSSEAYMRMRDGYLIQEVPFSIELKDFRIQHYATGQPKSFESDLVIHDPSVKASITQTIRVNHPLIYKGIAIYQSDFQDGGSQLGFKVWPLFENHAQPSNLSGKVFSDSTLGTGENALTVEFNDFRKFNILNMSADGKGKPKNVGPNVTFKLRNSQGQAKEYMTYMQPLAIDGQFYWVSGMRANPQDEFSYLRIPVDEDFAIEGFMRFRAVMFDPAEYANVAKRLRIAAGVDAAQAKPFEDGVIKLLQAFSQGGYTEIAKFIEQSIPEKDREKAAQAYLKIVNGAAFEAYQLAYEKAGKKMPAKSPEVAKFLQDGMNSMSDSFFYGAPVFLQLASYEHLEASGLQLTRSPGQFYVYLGSTLLVLGIFAMIYIRERRIWFLVSQNKVQFAMSSNRKNRDFDLEFAQYQQQLTQVLQ